MDKLTTLMAYKATASGKFLRVLERGIKDLMSGNPLSAELEESINRQAEKNKHTGCFEFVKSVELAQR